jgi:hypothetical protein
LREAWLKSFFFWGAMRVMDGDGWRVVVVDVDVVAFA